MVNPKNESTREPVIDKVYQERLEQFESKSTVIQELLDNVPGKTRLNLWDEDLDIDDDDIEVCLAIIAHNKNITTFGLSCFDDSYSARERGSVTDKSAEKLAQVPQLQSLGLNMRMITDEGARFLAQNDTLKSLYLMGNSITDEGAIELAKNNTLEKLVLSKNKITHQGAVMFAQNTNLKTLDLSNNVLDSETLKALANNTNLTTLNVASSGATITPEVARAFAENKTLINLDLANNNFTDGSLVQLLKNNTLRSLDTSGCTGIRAEDYLELFNNTSLIVERSGYWSRRLGVEDKYEEWITRNQKNVLYNQAAMTSIVLLQMLSNASETLQTNPHIPLRILSLVHYDNPEKIYKEPLRVAVEKGARFYESRAKDRSEPSFEGGKFFKSAQETTSPDNNQDKAPRQTITSDDNPEQESEQDNKHISGPKNNP